MKCFIRPLPYVMSRFVLLLLNYARCLLDTKAKRIRPAPEQAITGMVKLSFPVWGMTSFLTVFLGLVIWTVWDFECLSV